MRRRSTRLVAFAAVVLAGAAVSAAEDVRAAIEANNKVFSAAVARGDAAAVAALYTSAAQALPPGGEIARGRDAIQKAFLGMIDAGATDLTLGTLEVEAHGDTAHEVGTWALKAKDGTALDKGKFIVIWKKEAGQWRLHRDIWNSSTPPPAR
jgi:ketosteroid isomerase-like protein